MKEINKERLKNLPDMMSQRREGEESSSDHWMATNTDRFPPGGAFFVLIDFTN